MTRALRTLQGTHFAGREMEAQKGIQWLTLDDSSTERTSFGILLSYFIPAKGKNETKDFLIAYVVNQQRPSLGCLGDPTSA